MGAEDGEVWQKRVRNGAAERGDGVYTKTVPALPAQFLWLLP
jgi:hypothetical protein